MRATALARPVSTPSDLLASLSTDRLYAFLDCLHHSHEVYIYIYIYVCVCILFEFIIFWCGVIYLYSSIHVTVIGTSHIIVFFYDI